MTRLSATEQAARAMKESELADNVIACAHLFGWLVAHFRPAMTKHGWRTPVQADGKGFPDLVLANDGRVFFVELKRELEKVTPEQQHWLNELPLGKGFVWRPSAWLSGEVERVLRDWGGA